MTEYMYEGPVTGFTAESAGRLNGRPFGAGAGLTLTPGARVALAEVAEKSNAGRFVRRGWLKPVAAAAETPRKAEAKEAPVETPKKAKTKEAENA